MDTPRVWSAPFAPIRRLSADLSAIVLFVTVIDLTVALSGYDRIRFVVALPLALFLPGYALLAALVPGTEIGRAATLGSFRFAVPDRDLDPLERVALSYGVSVALLALVGLALKVSPLSVTTIPVVASLSAFTLVATGVAAVRRRQLPQADRYGASMGRWLDRTYTAITAPGISLDTALNVGLVLGVVLVAGVLVSVATATYDDQPSTSLYLLTEDEQGELGATDFPTEFVAGEPRPVVVGVENYEGDREAYTLVVQLRDAASPAGSASGRDVTVLSRETISLRAGQHWRRTYDLTPTRVGENQRLEFLLFRGTPPDDPTVENAYRHTYLWVNVSAADG